MTKTRRASVAWMAIFSFLAFVLAADLAMAEGSKKKKRKKRRKKEAVESVSPKKVLRGVNRDLLAYATADARAGLEPILDEGDPEHLLALARILAQERSYEESVAKLTAAQELVPNAPDYWVALGEVHLIADREAEADLAFSRAVALAAALEEADPESFEGHYFLGCARQRLRQFEAALESLSRARDLHPDDPMPIYQLGLTHAFQKQWQQAADLLNEALELNSGLAYAYYYRGLSQGRLGRKDLMINDLDSFLTLAPEAPEAKRARRLVEAASG